ncbi:MAG: hypothetical protein Alpg2KO_24460 [Alphaproteobacteria bacterium]
MQIVEQFIQGKLDDPATCEDALVVTDHLVAVIDGATDRASPLINGQSTGKLASDLIARTLENLSLQDLSPQDPTNAIADTPKSLFDHLCGLIAERMDHPDWPATASAPVCTVALYLPARRQVWRLGDPWVRIGDEVHGKRYRFEEAAIENRRAWINALLKAGHTVDELLADDPARAAYAPMAPLFRTMMNPPADQIDDWSAGTITNRPAPTALIDVLDVPAPCDSVILATDGWPFCPATLAEAQHALSDKLTRDPLLIGDDFAAAKGHYPGQTSFDDRCWVRLVP